MKLWLSKGSEVSLHEQLTLQLVLGIVSGDLQPGERLPSTQQLARRFDIHPNTARAAYRDLTKKGWLEWRPGSGFYVKTLNAEAKLDPGLDLDRLISTFFQLARDRGHTLSEIRSRVTRWFSYQPPDHIVLIEPEPELREILVTEIAMNTSMRVVGIGIDECSKPQNLPGGFCVALYDSAREVQAALPTDSCMFLHSRSISKSLENELKPDSDTVIIVVSRWPHFLKWAHTTLVAVGIDPLSIELRDARKKEWRHGLTARAFIITDSLMAHQLPRLCRPRIFQIISDESIAELNNRLQTGYARTSGNGNSIND